MSKRVQAELLLLLTTFIWGATFVVVKRALADASPLPFLTVRFGVAGLLLLAVLAQGRIGREAVRPGLILGVFLAGGYAFQTFAQEFTTPSKCAFITGFSVILVPLIMLFLGHRMRAANIAGALLGLGGLYFLVLPTSLAAVNRGDLLTLFGSICFAVHIVLVGQYTRRFSFRHLVPVQILSVSALAAIAVPLDSHRRLNLTPALAGAFVVTAVFATGFAFSVQNWAQQYAPAAHTALIFAMEPVFAALVSWRVMGERLGGRVLLGSALILAGMVISEMWGGAASPVEG
ncbi:MAG TPA: DMT family transporter [Terriglobia bacterium]|nr:DMT family transporter [Terriglobia bacterium]